MKADGRTNTVVAATRLAQGKFFAFEKLEWLDASGTMRTWETVERTGTGGAVAIVARLKPSNRLLLIRQFRPPARDWVYEFPAGLIEVGEDPAEGALRELREETGYRGKVVHLWPPAYTSPGLTNETVHICEAEIDENDPANVRPETEFDDSEMIETLAVPADGFFAFYRDGIAAGKHFDTRVAAYAISLARGTEGRPL